MMECLYVSGRAMGFPSSDNSMRNAMLNRHCTCAKDSSALWLRNTRCRAGRSSSPTTDDIRFLG